MHTDQPHILLQYDEDTGAGGSRGNAEMTLNGGLNSSLFFGAEKDLNCTLYADPLSI